MRQPTLGFDQSYRLEDGQRIIFDHYPVPPSVNALYKHFRDPRKKGKIVRVSTDEHKDYKERARKWALVNRRLVEQAKLYLRDELHIKVTVYVGIHDRDIYTKDGKVRQLDVSNFGKALYDCLADSLEIDDRHFADCRLIKTVAEDHQPWHCTVVFQRHDLQRLAEVKAGLVNKD